MRIETAAMSTGRVDNTVMHPMRYQITPLIVCYERTHSALVFDNHMKDGLSILLTFSLSRIKNPSTRSYKRAKRGIRSRTRSVAVMATNEAER